MHVFARDLHRRVRVTKYVLSITESNECEFPHCGRLCLCALAFDFIVPKMRFRLTNSLAT